jgi:hypothetical protein
MSLLGRTRVLRGPGAAGVGKKAWIIGGIASLFGAVGHLDLSETRYTLNSSDLPAFSYI